MRIIKTLVIFIIILLLVLGVERYYRKRGVELGKPAAEKTLTTVVEEDGKSHIRLSLQNSGMDIFNPAAGGTFDYSYGPGLILNDDGSVDAWFASPGDGEGVFDYVTWRHMENEEDGFSDERIVLSPTPGSMDKLSACDPDVFYYDGYYYLGYTATVDPTLNGLCNSVFLARATAPQGPYEKWNGSGWGGEPMPIIYYDGFSIGWGCGEPSFVVKDDELFVYSTKDAYSMQGVRVKTTEVRCTSLKDPKWPANLEYLGVCADRSDGTQEGYVFEDCDSWDVVYFEEYDKFLALCTNRRFTMGSCLLYFESDDGVYFERMSEINKNLICGCHNCGILGDGYGHIKAGDILRVCYSYAGNNDQNWGYWATRWAPFVTKEIEGVDRGEENKKNIKMAMDFRQKKTAVEPVFPQDEPSREVSGNSIFIPVDRYDVDLMPVHAVVIRPVLRDGSLSLQEIPSDRFSSYGITFEVSDENVCTVGADGVIFPVGSGECEVTMRAKGGTEQRIMVYVREA